MPARRTSTTPVRVYKYGALPPTEGGDVIRQQIRLADRYYNTLLEIALNQRRSNDAIMCAVVPEFASLTKQNQDLTDEINEAESEKDWDKAKALQKQRNPIRKAISEARKVLRQDANVTAALKEVSERAKALKHAARASCGVYWGTYLPVESAVEQALASPRPKFRRHDGTGRVGVQIAYGMSAPEVLDCEDTRLRIKPVPADTFERRRHHRRKASRTECWLRVQSDEKGKPVWAKFPIILHRPIPEDAKVTWAWLQVRNVGGRHEYTLQLTIESETFAPRKSEADEHSVALDWSWRMTEKGLRVAYWADSSGKHGEILVPDRTVSGMVKVDDLRGIRDKKFDAVKLLVSEWKKGHESEMVRERLSHVHMWRSQAKLVRFINDAHRAQIEIPKWLDAWAKKDRHLWFWQEQQRDRRLGHRKAFYREVAAQFARKYKYVFLENFRMTEIRQRKVLDDSGNVKIDRTGAGKTTSRWQASMAAPADLRSAMTAACAKYGSTSVLVSPEYTSQMCHLCGHNEPWQDKSEQIHTCENFKCRATWDRDYNAAKNILARGLAAENTQQPLDSSEVIDPAE